MKSLLALCAAVVGVFGGGTAGLLLPAAIIEFFFASEPSGGYALLGGLLCIVTIPLGAIIGVTALGWLMVAWSSPSRHSDRRDRVIPHCDPLSVA
jgi:hypothetical protein